MVRYYYDKYTVVPIWLEPTEWIQGETGNYVIHNDRYSLSYSWDKINKKFTFGSPLSSGMIIPGGTPVYAKNEGTYNLVAIVPLSDQYLGTNGTEAQCTSKEKRVSQSSYSHDEKGVLVQSNILAEDGSYPNNGKHIDGYWYVRKGVFNTAPLTPGAFTQPTGNLEIGDSKVFTVGSSSDEEGNLSKYIWEVSLNNGSYSKAGETQSSNFTYTIPTATSLKMRVKAVDSGGLESAYRESSSYTVTEPKYYWSKYKNKVITVQVPKPGWKVSYTQEYGGHAPGTRVTLPYINQDVAAGAGGRHEGTANGLKYVFTFVAVEGSPYLTLYCTVYEPTTIYENEQQDSKGELIESNIQAIFNAYKDNVKNSDGYWYVRGSRVSQSIAPPSPFTSPEGIVLKKNTVATIAFGASSAVNASYEVDYRYNQDTWVSLGVNSNLTRQFTITTDKSKKTVEFRVRAKNTSNVYSDYIYSSVFTIEHNVIPTVTINTQNNLTLYENSTFLIDGDAIDTDDDQSITAYYQIDNAPRKVLGTGVSKTPIVFNKQLVFKSGKLLDGDTAITDALAEGVAHTLKVWSQDDQGGISKEEVRSFYVVPNRAPVLTINPIDTSSCNIDNDSFLVNGTCEDLDGNEVIVSYRINKGLNTEIYRGKDGNWSFELSLKNLLSGENTIVVEVGDSFGAKTSVEKKLNKTIISTPILSSVARYKIKPANGTAKGVLLWIQRQKGLSISAEISMVLAGEQENFAPMELTNTASLSPGVIEDEFYFNTTESKDNIVVKLDLTRASADVSESIELISGVLE